MALTTTQVSELYVAIFGRVSEGAGNKAWKDAGFSVEETAKKMLETEAAKEYFGSSLNSNESFVKHIYLHTLNKTQAEDPDGVKGWVDFLNNGKSREWVITELIKAAKDPIHKTLPSKKAHEFFLNKVALSDYTAEKVEGAGLKVSDLAPFKEALKKVDSTASSLEEAKKFVDTFAGISADTTSDWSSKPVNPGTTVELTVDTDIKTANVFNAGMKHNPEDRILTLQDEDVLTGDPMRADNTLNVTFGMQNADEGDDKVRTPKLKDIQNINIEVTGTINTLDLRDTNDAEKINIDRVTASASDKFTVQSIGQKLEGIRLADVAKKDINVTLTHKEGVLAGREDKTVIYLDDIADAKSLTVNSENSSEGYEIVNLVSKQNVKLQDLNIAKLKEMTLKGGGLLNIADIKADASGQFDKIDMTKGIQAEQLTKFDASAFAGKLVLNIDKLVAEQKDPMDSGKLLDTNIKGSNAGDVFYLATNPGKRTTIDGGKGADKLVLVGGGIGDHSDEAEKTIKNIETLEIKDQSATAPIAVDFDRFDYETEGVDILKNIIVRNETTADDTSTFQLNNLHSKFVEDKDSRIIIEHDANNTNSAATISTKVEAVLKNSKGDNDTLRFEVVKSKNLDLTFEYSISAAGVENVEVFDNDNESNTLLLPSSADHKTTLTLIGGQEGQYYKVDGDGDLTNRLQSVTSKTIDASKQKSDLIINVADQAAKKGQTIKLGSGNDILTFSEIDGFDKDDKVSGGEGKDKMRAIFHDNKEKVALNVESFDEIHLAATNNVDIDLKDVATEKIVIMSDLAVQNTDIAKGVSEHVYGMGKTAAGEIAINKVITFDNSKLTSLTFSGDLNTVDTPLPADDDQKTQTFNGVTLTNNMSDTLALNIDSKLDDVIKGAQAYNIGQLTVHGVKNLSIKVADEEPNATEGKPANATTTIDNITGRDLYDIKVEAKGNVNLQTITGNGTFNNTKYLNAEKVGGKFTASIVSLMDEAEVKLGNGGSDFSALYSAGKKVKITAGKGDDIITGTAQDDIISAGDGKNEITGDRGDNVISVGKDNDTIKVKDGSNNVSLGKGIDKYLGNIDTKLVNKNMVTTIDKDAGVAYINFDVEGDEGTDASKSVNQQLFVAEKDNVKVAWEGLNLKLYSVNGGQAKAEGTDGNDHILAGVDYVNNTAIIKDTGLKVLAAGATVDGGKGDDVIISTQIQNKGIVLNGGEGNDTIVVNSRKEDTVNGGKGNDTIYAYTAFDHTISGGEGDDTIYLDGNVAFTNVEGGAGADKIYINNTGKADTITFKKDDSLVDSYDVIYGFEAKAGGDMLDLNGAVTAKGDATVDGTDAGTIKSHDIKNGFIKFANDNTFAGHEIVVNKNNIKDVLAYLAENIKANDDKAVAFLYDADGDTTNKEDQSIFVFVDGAEDTLVELAGLTDSVTKLDTIAAADTVLVG